MTKRIFRPQRCLLVVFAVLAMDLGLTSPAAAQGFLSFLWGGGSREVVAFHPAHPAGQIIVSFGDRRLYWVQRRGRGDQLSDRHSTGKKPLARRHIGIRQAGQSRLDRQPLRCVGKIRGFRRMFPAGTRSILWACARSISAPACTGSTAPMRPGRSAMPFRRDASGSTTRTCSIYIAAFPWAPASR